MNRKATILNSSIGARSQYVLVGLAGQFILPASSHYFSRVSRVLRRLSSRSSLCTVRLNADTELRFSLRDPYWTPLMASRYRYEPELEGLLRRLRETDYVFYDCGANLGYWSLMVTSQEFGAKKAVAVEALRRTYEQALANQHLNKRSFPILHRALSKTTGERAKIHESGEDNHAGASLLKDWVPSKNNQTVEEVVTISLDDLVKENPPLPGQSIVVKLDVEGLEEDVLSGASQTLAKSPMIIFEDHGKDKDCLVSKFVMQVLKLAIFTIDSSGQTSEISDISEIKNHKTNADLGYNFVGVKRDSVFYNFLKSGR